MISGLILAGGASRRMGTRPKALLDAGGAAFLERIADRMGKAGCGEVLVVLGAHRDEILAAVRSEGVKFVTNDEWERGMLSSLRAGIRALSPFSEAVLFSPVDHPFVRGETYQSLVEAWETAKGRIVVPTYSCEEGRPRRGHPAIFPRRLYGSILGDDLPDGARALLASEGARVLHVPVDDPAVLMDVDTPEDLERYRKGIQ